MGNEKLQHLLLAHVGATLLSCQMAESILESCLQYHLPLEFRGVLDEVLGFGKKKKDSLGRLLSQLQKSYKLNDSFCKFLEDFLERRNQFVHRFMDVVEYDLVSVEAIRKGNEFSSKLRKDALEIAAIFQAFGLRHHERHAQKEFLELLGFYSKDDDFMKKVEYWKKHLDLLIQGSNSTN